MIVYKRKWSLSGKQLFMKPIRIAGFKKIHLGLLADILLRVLYYLMFGAMLFGAWKRDGGFQAVRASQLFAAFFAVRMLLPLAAQLLVFFGLQEVVPISAWFARGKKWLFLSILAAIVNFITVTVSHTAISPASYAGIRLSAVVYVLELVGSGLLLVCLARGMWETIYHCGGEERVEQRLLGLEWRVWLGWTADIVLSLLFAVSCGAVIPQLESLGPALRSGAAVTQDDWILLAFLAVFSLVELWRILLRAQLTIASRRAWKIMDILST